MSSSDDFEVFLKERDEMGLNAYPDKSALRSQTSANTSRLGDNSWDEPSMQSDTTVLYGLRQRNLDTRFSPKKTASNETQATDPYDNDKSHAIDKNASNTSIVTANQNYSFADRPWESLGWTSSMTKKEGGDKISVVNQSQYLEDLKNTDRHIRLVTAGGAISYVILVALVYGLCPSEHIQQVEGVEHTAAMLSFVCLLLSIILRMLPFLYHGGSMDRRVSGIIVGAMTVQCIALVTDFVMAAFPTPVVIDPITSSRVHLLRWCEWSPLAFMMTFMTEAADVPDPVHGLKIAYLNAACMGLSTLCGLIFPFCTGWLSWSFWMTISCILYFFLFPRLYQKIKSAKYIKKGQTLDEIEVYDRFRLSLQLMVICVSMWSLIVLVYFVTSCGPMIFPEGSLWRHPGVPMIGEAFMDVVAKVIYMFIIVDVHDAAFDKVSRTKRRLDELRRMMSVVWESSSDVLVISVKSLSGSATTIVSPTFVHMLDRSQGGSGTRLDGPVNHRSLVFDLNAESIQPDNAMGEHSNANMYDIDFSRISLQPSWPLDNDDSDEGAHGSSFATDGETTAMAQLVARAWRSPRMETLILHDLIRQRGNFTTLIPCEAKVTHLDDTAVVVVVRDVSERYKRFEAEKRVVSEMTARQKDAEANRFTRHEVKNGLLAAIGLCDSLSETVAGEHIHEWNKDEISSSVIELDKTLREILDTVLSEAMARDVINEIYQPQNERVDFNEALCMKGYVVDTMSGKGPRFPLITYPSPLPTFFFDPQLLRFVHRNAVSNACKYGKKGGVVQTMVHYNALEQRIRMNVINLPGSGHEEILKLGSEANEMVFGAGQRLHIHRAEGREQNGIVTHSAGDGAWIMRKCAKTLGGECLISFEDIRTVFSFSCPATPFDVAMKMQTSMDTSKFVLPPRTWGIAIDDSKIQRRLLQKVFRMAGVCSERTIILGKNTEEIRGFVDFMVEFVDLHSEDYFFVIVDENLHLRTDGDELHVSGSLCIQSVRDRLIPEHERRMLAVVRSANDSAHDVAIYNSRAHGFFPKAPTKKEGVTDMIAPLWEKRFARRGSITFAENLSDSSDDSFGEDVVTVADLMGTIEEIDEILLNGPKLHSNWPLVREKLHYLKGDILTLPDSFAVSSVVDEINSMRSMSGPDHFPDRWQILRQMIVSI